MRITDAINATVQHIYATEERPGITLRHASEITPTWFAISIHQVAPRDDLRLFEALYDGEKWVVREVVDATPESEVQHAD